MLMLFTFVQESHCSLEGYEERVQTPQINIIIHQVFYWIATAYETILFYKKGISHIFLSRVLSGAWNPWKDTVREADHQLSTQINSEERDFESRRLHRQYWDIPASRASETMHWEGNNTCRWYSSKYAELGSHHKINPN